MHTKILAPAWEGMGDGVQILKWTLTTVHSYWFEQTLQGEKVAFKEETAHSHKSPKHYDRAEMLEEVCARTFQKSARTNC